MKLNTRNTLLLTYIITALIPILVLFGLNWYTITSIEDTNRKNILDNSLKESLIYLENFKDIFELNSKSLFKEFNDQVNNKRNNNNLNILLKKLSHEYEYDFDFIYLIDKNSKIIKGTNVQISKNIPSFESLKNKMLTTLELFPNKGIPSDYKKIPGKNNLCTFSPFKNYNIEVFCDAKKELYHIAFIPVKDKHKDINWLLVAGKSITKDAKNIRGIINKALNINFRIVSNSKPIQKNTFLAYKTFYNWENRPIVTLIIWNDPKMFSKTLIDTELMTLKVFAVSAVLIFIFLYILSKLMVRPIEKLLSATNEIAKDNFEVKISDIKGPTEFEDLASSFNKMASELSEKRKVQEDFIATLAHDMKVPLIAEKKAIDLLINYEQYKLSEDQILLLKNMLASNNLLLELVNNLLLTYKIEAGMHKSSKNTHNIVRLIYETVTDLNLLAKEKNQELTFDYTEDSIWVNMDQNDIKRVLINLISNAINYTDKNGKINVNISTELEKIIVIVKDNGYGIAEEEKPKLFKRFSRGTKKLKNIGTGLGLYLCNLIIQEHNGKIWFESEINKGSTFYFSLPRE